MVKFLKCIIEKLEKFPEAGEVVDINNISFIIENIGKNRIKRLRVRINS